jgi:CheY-like chemotaxis protein
MPAGGTLSVTTREAPADSVVVTVGDTGVGMSETVRRRIFEPFFSTKGEAGSGLGLAMAYSIVKRHGGEIRVESEPGRGATFTISFPAAREAAGPARPSDASRPRRPVRVLAVDDDPQVLATLVELLQSLGHTVTGARNGAAALQLYAPGRFDVVLTNVGMAIMNGWEFTERVRAIDTTVAILFITGWGLREEDRARLAALKVGRCLFKPVRPADLDAAIQAVVPSA